MSRRLRYTIIFIALALFTGVIYYVRPDRENVKEVEKKLKGRSVTLVREMVIARRSPKVSNVLPYFMQEKGESFYTVVNELYSIPAGSKVAIQKIQPFTVHTPAMHGRPETEIEHIFVICEVYSTQKEDAIVFEYDLNNPSIKAKGYPWE